MALDEDSEETLPMAIPIQPSEPMTSIKSKAATPQSAQPTTNKPIAPKPQIISKDDPALKAVVKPKPRKLAEVLKSSYQPNTLSRRLLDQKMEVTVRELVATTPEIERILTKALEEGEVAEFKIMNLTSTGDDVEQEEDEITYPDLPTTPFPSVPRNTSWFAMGCPTAQVALDRSYKLLALLDSGSQVNVMDKPTMIKSGLAMRPGPKIRLISHNGSSAAFLGICENVEVDIGGLVTICSIFVVEKASHALVLGQPFLVKTRFQQTYEGDNVFGTFSNESQTISVIFRTLIPSKAGHTDRSELFPLKAQPFP